MKNYSVLAKYYDRFSHNDCDYESWSQYLFAVAQSCNAKNVVDLACGTGKMTKLLAKGGFSLLGVDSSAEMLQEASNNCRKATFVLQDMRKLSLTRKADMITIVNDGVNYISQQELPYFFATIFNNLNDGGAFVFDVSSPYKLKSVLGNEPFFYDCDDATLLWTNKLLGDKVQMDLTLFEKAGPLYSRQDERHVQYVHTQQDVANALQSAGLTLQQVSSEYGKPLCEDSLRITYYAKKGC